MIDEEITLNGVEYIRKDAVKNDDILELKGIVASILSETQENVDKIIDSYIKNDMQVPKNHIQEITDDEYQIKIFPSAQVLYENFIIKDDGDIVIRGHTLPFDMYDVAEIEENVSSITNDSAKSLSDKFNVSLTTIHKLIYNIIEGTFKGYNFNPLNRPQKEKRQCKMHDNNSFIIQESNKALYKIVEMKPTGELHAYKGKKFDLNIHQVLKVQSRVIGKDITVGRAKQIASDIGISYPVLQRVAYNILEGTFDEYINEWRIRLSQPVLQAKTPIKMPVQNNPEKRAEGGYYTGGYGY